MVMHCILVVGIIVVIIIIVVVILNSVGAIITNNLTNIILYSRSPHTV